MLLSLGFVVCFTPTFGRAFSCGPPFFWRLVAVVSLLDVIGDPVPYAEWDVVPHPFDAVHAP